MPSTIGLKKPNAFVNRANCREIHQCNQLTTITDDHFYVLASFILNMMMLPSTNPSLCALWPLSDTESNMAALHHQFSHHSSCSCYSGCLESEIVWQQF